MVQTLRRIGREDVVHPFLGAYAVETGFRVLQGAFCSSPWKTSQPQPPVEASSSAFFFIIATNFLPLVSIGALRGW